jgi:hypothetical protein
MNRLDPLHYLPVLLKPVAGRVVIFNPIFQKRLKENQEFLERLKLPNRPSPYLNNHYFDELEKKQTIAEKSILTEDLLAFALESISLPSKLADHEYYQLTQGNYLTVTEKFLSRHVCGHVAATRHILLKNIQIKGVGRTASTQQLSYPNMNGFIRTSEAVRGYYNAMLLHSSLPHGSVKLHAVICVIDNKLHSSLVIRDADSHRLAQIEPVFLNQQDKKTLHQEVLHYFGTDNSQMILQRVLEQHICLWVMGVEHPMTVDNLALAGFPMDEEDMRPGWDMQKITLDFNVKFHSDGPLINTFDDLMSESFDCNGGVVHRFKLLLQWYQESLSWILDEAVKEFNRKEKLNFIQKILSRFYLESDVEKFMTILSWLEDFKTLNKSELKELIRKLNTFKVVPELSDQKMQARFTVLRLPIPMRLKDDLRGRFNQQTRISTEKVVARFSRFEMDDHTHNNHSAFQNSSQLHRVANRHAFCLADSEEMSLEQIETYIIHQLHSLQLHSLTFYSSNGFITTEAQNWKTTLLMEKEVILVEVNVWWEGKPFALPTFRKLIHIKS